jgi:hypothetical protein
MVKIKYWEGKAVGGDISCWASQPNLRVQGGLQGNAMLPLYSLQSGIKIMQTSLYISAYSEEEN